MTKPEEIGWQTRFVPMAVGAKGWFRKSKPPGQQCNAALEPGTPLTVVEIHHDGTNDVTVCHGAYQHLRLPADAVDLGLEYRITCPWLRENHPKVQEYLKRKIAKLEALPHERYGNTQQHRQDEIDAMAAILKRHGVFRAVGDDDQPL